MAMRCPYCGSDNTKVRGTRVRLTKQSQSRRLECRDCQKRFTTIEFVVPEGIRPDPQELIDHWQKVRRAPSKEDRSRENEEEQG